LSTFRSMSEITRHCHACGCVYVLNGNPGRLEGCEKCGADLKVCLNCVHYAATGYAHHCKERRAEEVFDKTTANFCEWFDFARREFKGAGANTREDSARDGLKKLLGD
jgi:hypothetical protein